MASTPTNELRPGARVYHGQREATVLAVDSDPEGHAWILYADNPDEDAFVHRGALGVVRLPCMPAEPS